MSTRGDAEAALFTLINGATLGVVRRADGGNATPPKAGALVTQEDGTLDGERMLSYGWSITHTIPITIEALRRQDRDNAVTAIGALVSDNPTLGGIVDWCEIGGADLGADATTGKDGQPMPRTFAASLTATLWYCTLTGVG